MFEPLIAGSAQKLGKPLGVAVIDFLQIKNRLPAQHGIRPKTGVTDRGCVDWRGLSNGIEHRFEFIFKIFD